MTKRLSRTSRTSTRVFILTTTYGFLIIFLVTLNIFLTRTSIKKDDLQNFGRFVPPLKPSFDDLLATNKSEISKDRHFIESCKKMAGYYKNKTRSLKNTLLMTVINYGYKDFLHNFKCFCDRLGIQFLSISLDNKIYKYLIDSKFSITYLMPQIAGRDGVRTEASGFGGINFNLISCRKIEAVYGALELGYDVIFSDVDIAIIRDPIKFLFYPDIDYVHSQNIGCGGKWAFNDTMEGNTELLLLFYSNRIL